MKRITTQQKILNQTIHSMDNFFDAYELLSKTKKKGIGIATVYRYLKSLELKGNIHSYICNNKKIYSINEKNHAHFTCEICKDKKHIKIHKVDFLQEATEEDVCHFQIDITGICKKCKKLK